MTSIYQQEESVENPLIPLDNLENQFGTFNYEMDAHNDPMIRDKKSSPNSSLITSVPTFFMTLFVVTPVWLTILLPLAVLGQTGVAISRAISPKKTRKPSSDSTNVSVQKRSTDLQGRDYDLILYGATGFTGEMAAKYLAKNYGNKVNWAIAGRRKDALMTLRAELVRINPALDNLPIILADSQDERSIDNMAAMTKVLITTAGKLVE
jgi:hypothetical protein